MRLNSVRRNLPNENSSAFYSAFAGAFDTILDPRPIQDSTWTKYVPVETSEKGLKSFINSSVDVTTKGILLFKGGQGTGKSSTLFEIHRQYRDKKTTRSLLVDLRQHGSKIPDTLGSIVKLDDRVSACIPRVRELLSSRFEGACRRPLADLNLDRDEITLEVFYYCFHHHLHVLPVQLRNSPHVQEDGDTAELLSVIKGYLQSDFSFHDAFCFVKYIYVGVKYQNLRKFTVIIDNGDQLPYEMMEAAVFCANHYSGCLNSSRPRRSKNDGVVVGKAKINFIIACRHHNYEKLVARSNVNALGSHSHKALTHAGIPGLSKIIRRRIRQTKKIGEYTFSSGIRLSDVSARRAIYAYFRQLEDSGCFDQIMAIHNRNLADAFDCIRAVTRNPIFPKFDQFVQDFAIKRSKDRRYTVPLNALIVLRCLVWGSPRSFSEAMYPTLPSDIPNLYDWNGIDLLTFGLKARILQILIKIGATAHNNRMEGLNEVYRIASEALNISQEQFVSTLIDMARERLVFSYAEQDIFVVNSYDSVSASWRGEYLLQNVGRYSPLALAYLEDFEIVSGDEGEIVAEVGRPLRAQSSDAVISMINYAFKVELAQVEALEEIGTIDKFLTVFPRTPISDELFKALRRDIRDVEQDLAVDFSETRASLNAKMKKRGGIANLKRHTIKQGTVPRILEQGVRVIVDNVSDEERRQLFLELMVEVRTELSKADPEKGKIRKLRDRLTNAVKFGRDGEKVMEWGQDFAEALDALGGAPPV